MVIRQVPVTLYVLNDAETGETWVLPDDRDIRDFKRQTEISMEYADQVEASGKKPDKIMAEGIRMDARRRQFEIDKIAESLPEWRKNADERSFMLIKHSAGVVEEWEGEATIMNEDRGTARLDEQRLMNLMMPASVEGYDKVSLAKLEPEVKAALWILVRRMTRSDPLRIPLSLRPSGNS